MMRPLSYEHRRSQLETYFDRTAVDAWKRLTSSAPVGRIRATVRAGRDEMRSTLLSWLPQDLRGARVLDAGCGTGALSVEAARRGAHVVGVDLSPTLLRLAAERLPAIFPPGRVEFVVGDMLETSRGGFDYIVAMDSLIHYRIDDVERVLAQLAANATTALAFTFAPRTALLTAMHTVGRAFPRGNRSPLIEPITERRMQRAIATHPGLGCWQAARTQRVVRGFYISQALEIVRR